MGSCPSPEQLGKLVTGNLPDCLIDTLESHLLECVACQAAVRDLQLGDAFIEQIRGAALQPPPAGLVSEDQNLVERLIADAADPARNPTRELDANPDVEVSSESDRFSILRLHARGGLGEVFLAHDKELGREVALKQIQRDRAHDTEARTRFTREAEITGGLEHPGIVPVYGLGAYPDGRPFYAMRFVRGQSLNEAIRAFHRPVPVQKSSNAATAKHLELRRLLQRFIDVCEAIEYAHTRSVLHRDLKPDNIMLGRYGETLVVDWGLAKPLAESGNAPQASDLQSHSAAPSKFTETPLVPASHVSSEQTGAHFALGTPAYMSPEQALGRHDCLGPASDVFSLGATLYHILTGRPPYIGQQVVDVQIAATKAEFPRPRSLIPSLPVSLEAICLKALKANPSDRYSTAKALADDIEHFLGDEPVSAMPEPLSDRLARWSRRHRHWVRAGAVSLFLIAVGLGVAWRIADVARQGETNQRIVAETKEREALEAGKQAEIARLAAVAAREQERIERQAAVAARQQERIERLAALESERRAKAATAFLVDTFGSADPVIGIQGTGVPQFRLLGRPATAREVLDSGRRRIDQELSNQPLTRATLFDAMGLAYLGLGDTDSAQPLIQQALQIREAELKLPHPDLLDSHFSDGIWQYAAGDFDLAERRFRGVLTAQEQEKSTDPLVTARTKYHLALVLGELQQYPEAEKLLREALAVRRARLGDKHPDVLAIRVLLILPKTSDSSSIMDVLKELGLDTPEVSGLLIRGILRFNSIRLQRQNHHFDAAVAAYLPLLEDAEKTVGPGHPICLAMRFDIAGLMQQQGDYVGAEKKARETLASMPRSMASNSRLAEVHYRLGQFANGRGDDKETEARFRDAIRIGRRVQNNQPWGFRARSDLVYWYLGQGKVAKAEELARETLKLAATKPDAVGAAESALQAVLAEVNKFEEAIPSARASYEKLLQIRKTWPHSQGILPAGENLMRMLQQHGELTEARTIELALRKHVDEMVAEIGENHKPEYVRTFAQFFMERGEWDKAEQLHRQAAAAERKRGVPRHPELAYSLNSLPRLLVARGGVERVKEACGLYREIYEILRGRFGEDHLSSTSAAMDLVLALHSHGDTVEALKLAKDVYERRRGIYGIKDLRTQDAAFLLAHTLEANDPAEALRLARESLTIRTELFPITHSQHFRAVLEFGDFLERRPDAAQAVEHYLQFLREIGLVWSPRTGPHAEIRGRLASCYLKQRKFAEAEPLVLQNLEIAQSAWSKNDSRFRSAVELAIRYYEATENTDAAERHRHLLNLD